MEITKNSFPKSERLISKKIIEELFKQGKSTFLYPFKLVYLVPLTPTLDNTPQILISVSKRQLKRAVDRNLIKRRIREVYRLHKTQLLTVKGKYPISYLGIIYVAKEKIPYSVLEEKLMTLFKRLRQ